MISQFLRELIAWVICDEAQAIKNPNSERRMTLAALPRRNTLTVTGTPIENSLVDMFSLIDFAIPGLLGTEDEFRSNYRDDDQSANLLHQHIGPVVLKRLVKDVAKDLPERIDIDIPIQLGPRLSKKYNEVREMAIENYPKAGGLVATLQLQLFCAHPFIQEGGLGDSASRHSSTIDLKEIDIETPKIEVCKQIVREAFSSGRKVLIFSSYNAMTSLLRKAFNFDADVFTEEINGSTPQEARQEIIDAFEAYLETLIWS